MKRFHPLAWLLVASWLGSLWLVGCTQDTASKQAVQPTAKQTEKTAEPAPAPAAEKPAGKTRITKLDDLPKHTYPFTGPVVEVVKSEAQAVALATKVRGDIEADLAQYDIDDHSTLQRMYATLLNIELLEKNYDAALHHIERIRALESKPAKKLVTGLLTQALVAARREVGENAPFEQYQAAFRRHLSAKVVTLPWDVVQDEIQQGKGQMEIFNENLLLGVVQAQVQPAVDRTGELNAEQAAGVLGLHLMLTQRLPLKEQIIAVYQEQIDAHQEAKPDIWAARSVTLAPTERHEPILIAVWDSGTDPTIFEHQLWVNRNESFDGQDDDGNGYIDDVYGVAFDINAERTTGPLCPLGEATERIPQAMQHMKGFMDIQAAVDSVEAKALKQHLGTLKPEEVKAFLEDLTLAGNHAHGTHVAGIMLDGNPFARVLIARLSYDHRTVPIARTADWGRRDAAKCRDTAEYFKQHSVRVVNMSWGEAQKDAEDSLEKNGIGQDADGRRQLAREVFALQRQGLHDAIQGAPDILFICAAGNADNDVEFDEYIPSSFDLANLLVVGAVDQAGEPTSFTSFGRTVQVYASGFEVESYVPGGKKMKMSGTSMASPAVANLAAKLLALDPTLTPAQVIELIKKGADPKAQGARSYLLINPKRTVELLREKTGRPAGETGS